MEPKFEVEWHPNPSCRSFHTDVEIGRSVIDSFQSSMSTGQCRSQLMDRLGNAIGKLVYTLLNIRNVEYVFLKQYEIDVHMRDGCRWNDEIDKFVKESFYQAMLEKVSNASLVLIERFPNSRIRDYNLKVELSRSHRENFYRPLRDNSQEYLGKVGYPGNKIVEKLFDIPGVIEIDVEPYEIRVEIAKVFEWDDIEPEIKRVFEDVLGRNLSFRNT